LALERLFNFGFGWRVSNSGPSPSRGTLTGTSRFRPKKFVKEVFCAKKAKTRNAFNKRFGKKPADGSIISFCFAILLRFRPKDQNLAGKRSIGIGTLFNFGFGWRVSNAGPSPSRGTLAATFGQTPTCARQNQTPAGFTFADFYKCCFYRCKTCGQILGR